MSTSKSMKRIGAAFALARIVAINVLGMVFAAGAAIHVYNRQTSRHAAPIARGVLAAHAVPTASARGALPAIDLEIEIEAPSPDGSGRAPASPGVNEAIRR